MGKTETEPLIDSSPQLQSYCLSLKSHIGYKLMLGDTRHFGYWESDTWWPFPIGRSLRAMEGKLASSLNLPAGSHVLDAGCGIAHVALYLAENYGLRIDGIDVVDYHIAEARRNISRAVQARKFPPGQIIVRQMDYDHLEGLSSEDFDGIYTMEKFVHATDPSSLLAGFFRILRPGGRLSMFEYYHELVQESPSYMAQPMKTTSQYAAMPTNSISNPGALKRMLEDAGFFNVEVHDYSENIRPMRLLFYLVTIVPYYIITLLGLQSHFVNIVAGVRSYQDYGNWHYINITADKPGGSPVIKSSKSW